MIRTLLLLICSLTPIIGQANSIDINLSEHAFGFYYSKLSGSGDYGHSEIASEAIYSTDKSKNDNFMLNFSLHIVDETGSKSPGLDAGLGPKLFLGTSEYIFTDSSGTESQRTQNMVALALGGLMDYRIPRMNRVVIHARAYYAPDITAMVSIEDLLEFGLRFGYEVGPSTNLYLGYRLLRGSFRVAVASGNGDQHDVKARNIDNSLSLGVKMNF